MKSESDVPGREGYEQDERWPTMLREAEAFVAYPRTQLVDGDKPVARKVAIFALRMVDLVRAAECERVAIAIAEAGIECPVQNAKSTYSLIFNQGVRTALDRVRQVLHPEAQAPRAGGE